MYHLPLRNTANRHRRQHQHPILHIQVHIHTRLLIRPATHLRNQLNKRTTRSKNNTDNIHNYISTLYKLSNPPIFSSLKIKILYYPIFIIQDKTLISSFIRILTTPFTMLTITILIILYCYHFIILLKKCFFTFNNPNTFKWFIYLTYHIIKYCLIFLIKNFASALAEFSNIILTSILL